MLVGSRLSVCALRHVTFRVCRVHYTAVEDTNPALPIISKIP